MATGKLYSFTVTPETLNPTECVIEFGDQSAPVTVSLFPSDNLVASDSLQHQYSNEIKDTVQISALCTDNTGAIADAVEYVVVLRSLEGLELSTSASLVPVPPGNISLTITFTDYRYTDQEIYILRDMGDGSVFEETLTNTENKESITYVHTYTIVDADMTIEINASNLASEVILKADIRTEEPLSGGELTCDTMKLAVGERAKFSLSLNSKYGAMATVAYGDGVIETQAVEQNSDLYHEYSEAGDYTVFVSAYNNISVTNITMDAVLMVRNSLDALNVDFTDTVSLPEGDYEITIASSKTFIGLECSFDVAGFKKDANYPFINGSESKNLKFNLSSLTPRDNYAVSGRCSDGVTDTSFLSSFIILETIGDLRMTLPRNLTEIGTSFTVLLEVTSGSNISFIVSFGNSQLETIESVSETSATFTGRYDTSGTFMVRGSAVNSVSSATTSALMHSLEPMKDVAFTTTSLDLYSGRYFGGTGSKLNKYNLDRKFVILANVSSGTNLHYECAIDNGTTIIHLQSKEPYFAIRYYEPQNITINCSVTNGVADIFQSMDAELLAPAFVTSFTNDGPQKAKRNVTYTLVIKNPTYTTCVLMDLQDETVLYGGEICKEIFKSHAFTELSYQYKNVVIRETMEFTEFYEEQGSYTRRVTVYNWIFKSYSFFELAITKAECQYPVVTIYGVGYDVEVPMVFFVNQILVLEASVVINCEFSSRAIYTWTLYRTVGDSISSYTNELINGTLNPDPNTLLRSVVFQAHSLEPNTLYNASLTVQMADVEEIHVTKSIYFFMKDRPLILVFLLGTETVVGYNKDFTIDVVTKSSDPDAPKWLGDSYKKHFRYVWLCHRLGEPSPDPDTAPLIDIPTERVNVSVFTDKGGCFTTGAGRLNVDATQGSILLNSNLSPLNVVLIIQVIVTHKTKTGRAESRISTVPGTPETISIECMANCGSKINPSDRYALLGRCETCDGLEMDYSWSISYFDEDVQEFIPYTNISDMAPETGSTDRSISFLENTLPIGTRIQARLNASSFWSTPTYTLLEIETTKPPFGGLCSVSPAEGTAMETSFTVTWKDWINPETETAAGLKYKVYIYHRDEPPALLRTSSEPVLSGLVFGPAEEADNFTHHLVFDVLTELGAFAGSFHTIQVHPLALEDDDMDQFLESKNDVMSSLMTSGNVQEGREMAAALALTLNSAPSAGAGLARSITTTEKPKTSTMGPGGGANRAKLRDSLAASITSTPVNSLDAILQSANTMSAITNAKDEVSESSQLSTVGFMSNMADTLTHFTEGLNGDPPSLMETVSSAAGMISSIANVGTAAKNAFTAKMSEASSVIAAHTGAEWSGSSTPSPEELLTTLARLSTTTESPTTMSLIATTVAALDEAATQVRSVTKGMMAVTESVADSLIRNQVPGQAPIEVASPDFQLKAGRVLKEHANNKSSKLRNGVIKMPSVESMIGNSSIDFLNQKTTAMKEKQQNWVESAANINSPVLSMVLGNGTGNNMKINNLEEDFVIDLDIEPHLVPLMTMIRPLVNRQEKTWGTIHSVTVADPSSAIAMVVLRTNDTDIYDLFMSYQVKPTPKEYNMTFTLPRELTQEEMEGVPPEDVEEMRGTLLLTPDMLYGPGNYSIMILQRVNISFEIVLPDEQVGTATPEPIPTPAPEEEEDFLFGEDDYLDPWYWVEPDVDELYLSNYSMQLVAPSCRYWDDDIESWETDGCRVGFGTTVRKVRCLCNHLTSFGSDFFVPPNTIDFGSAFSDLGGKLADNYAVLLTICIMIGVYIVIGIWARYKDKQDVKKWGVTPLEDNMDSEKNLYLLTVSTGVSSKAGTASNIMFNLAGERDQTGVRKLFDGKRKHLTRGSQVRYVASCENQLGRLETLRIWHDNTGKGDDAGWYLDRVTVSDLQTGRTYAFLVNQWFAVDENDGQIDRMISVASPQELTAFSNLFANNSKKNLTDGHLWISVFLRPYQSTYTRLQRLSVVISVTFLTMVVNAMFYATEPVNTGKFELGFITITTFQLWVSFMGTIIVIPPSILMDQIFRKARPKPSKTDPILKRVAEKQEKLECGIPNDGFEKEIDDEVEQEEEEEEEEEEDHHHEDYEKQNEKDDVDYTSSEIDSEDDEVVKKKKMLRKKMKKKVKKSYPWWTIYIGWTLCLVAIAASSFFVFAYSMQWGKEKSNSWLMAMSLSVFQSVMIFQPLKVFVMAAIIAICLKKPDIEDLSEEERKMNGVGGDDETVVVDMPRKGKREKVAMKPINKKKLERLRQKRLMDVEMLTLIKQIMIYAIYLVFLLFLAQQNRNSNAYYINDNIKNMFVNYEAENYESYIKPADLINYIRKTFVVNAYWTEEYNKDVVSWRNQPFMTDRVSFRIGAIRLRQLRINPDMCKTHPQMAQVSDHCNVGYSFDDEDKNRYFSGWRAAGNGTTQLNSPWSYRSMGQLKGAPVMGLLTSYNGGGFVVDLTGNRQQVNMIVDHLEKKEWLDKYTRAVFIELGVLNPYVNMFSRVCLLTEFSNTGLALKSYQINTFQLYSYVGPGAVWIIFCEAMVLIFIVVFLVRVCKKLKKIGRSYLASFWNFMELVKVIFSIVAIIMYMMKNAYVTLTMGDIADRSGEFMNFQRLALWNEIFIWLISFVCFVSILECLNLLRFNVRMSMLARTLRTCSADLAAFSLTFFITFMAFVQFAYVAFSPTMQIYKGLVTTMETMVGHLLGHIDMVDMLQQYGYFGVCFYVVFILLMTFIVMNMFFTIMGEAFSITKEQLANEKNQYELMAFISGLICDLMGWKEKPKLGDMDDEDDESDDGFDDEDEELMTEEQKEKREQKRIRRKERELERLREEAMQPPETTFEDAPPPALYMEPVKPDPNTLPPMPRGPAKDLPISILRSPVAGRGALPTLPPIGIPVALAAPTLAMPPQTVTTDPVSSSTPAAYAVIGGPGGGGGAGAPQLGLVVPNIVTSSDGVDGLPPPIYYEPPKEDELTELPGMAVTERTLDFLNIAPLPDTQTLYGDAWELYFGRTSMRPIDSITPVVARKATPLPPIQTDSALCRLEDVEASLNAMMRGD